MRRPSCAVLVHGRKALPDAALAVPDVDVLHIVTDRSQVDRFRAVTDDVGIVPDLTDVRAVFEHVVALGQRLDVRGVLAPVEPTLPLVGHLRSLLGLPGPGLDVIAGFTNKVLMKDRLRAAGLPVTRYLPLPSLAYVPRAARALGYPLVVKPAFGGGSIDVVAVADDAAAAALPDRMSDRVRDGHVPLLAEAWVTMSAELHLDGVVEDGEVRYVAVSRYFDPLLGRIESVTGSAMLGAQDPLWAPAVDLHERSVRALGLRDGVTHLELFVTGDGLLVGEVACRPAGGGIPRAIELQDGVDLWRALNRTCLGLPTDVHSQPTPGLVVNIDLPIRTGRITRITAAAELELLPGVVEVTMSHHEGDVISEPLWSAAATGIVHARVGDAAGVPDVVARVTEAFNLEVDTDMDTAWKGIA